MRNTRPILWIKAARKSFEKFPPTAQLQVRVALTFAAEGRKTPKQEIDLVRERLKRVRKEYKK